MAGKTWKDALHGVAIVDVAVIDNETFAFCANHDETSGVKGTKYTRLISYNLRTGNWFWRFYDRGFDFARVVRGRTEKDTRQALFADAAGKVCSFAYKDGPNDDEPRMPLRGAKQLGFVGSHFYTCGLGRSFARREGPGVWTVLDNVNANREEERAAGSFRKLCGQAEDDIYLLHHMTADGTHSQLLHWDGKGYSVLPFPASVTTEARDNRMFPHDMVQAPDGTVYVSGNDGELLAAAGGTLQEITKQDRRALPGMNLCWFKGVLYGAIDAGLFRFDFDSLEWAPALFLDDENAPVAFPYIDANDDVMLLAGAGQAALFDGEKWLRIAGDTSAMDMLRLQLMEQQAEDLTDLSNILESLNGLR